MHKTREQIFLNLQKRVHAYTQHSDESWDSHETLVKILSDFHSFFYCWWKILIRAPRRRCRCGLVHVALAYIIDNDKEWIEGALSVEHGQET